MLITAYHPISKTFVGETNGNRLTLALTHASTPPIADRGLEEKVATSIATFFIWASQERDARPIPIPAVTIPDPPDLPFSLDIDVTTEDAKGWETVFHLTTRYRETDYDRQYRDRTHFTQYQFSANAFYPRFMLLFQLPKRVKPGAAVDQLKDWIDTALPAIRQLLASLFSTLGEGEPEEIIAARVFARWSDPRCYPKIAFDPTTFRFHLRGWQLCPTCEWAIYDRCNHKAYLTHVQSYQHLVAELGISEAKVRKIVRSLKALRRLNADE